MTYTTRDFTVNILFYEYNRYYYYLLPFLLQKFNLKKFTKISKLLACGRICYLDTYLLIKLFY